MVAAMTEEVYQKTDQSPFSPGYSYDIESSEVREDSYHDHDVFGDEANHDIKYKTLSWQVVALLMIAEIVSNGMLSIPSALATVGLAPGIIIIIFLGVFATYTSYLLVQFKLNHPEGKSTIAR